MYLDHFGLATNPFGLSPHLDFLYRSDAFEESMAHLVYGLDNGEAITMITGPIGTGKTLALQSFLSHLGPRFSFALITNTRVNSLELLKLILEDLEIAIPRPCDKSDLLIMFKDHLLGASAAGKRVLVVIDEAQNLSGDVLEEIRLLTNLGQGNSQPVQIILVGQPELEAHVAQAGLAQLRQRIRVHYRLEPLSRDEVAAYLAHRMSVAGCDRPVFEKNAIAKIHDLSGGIPRIVNSIAGNALLSAFVAGRKKVQAEDIEPPNPELAFSAETQVASVPAQPVEAPERPAATPEHPVAAPQLPVPPSPEPVREHPGPQTSAPELVAGTSAAKDEEPKRRRAGWVLSLVVVVLAVVAIWYWWPQLNQFMQGSADPVAAGTSANPPPDMTDSHAPATEAQPDATPVASAVNDPTPEPAEEQPPTVVDTPAAVPASEPDSTGNRQAAVAAPVQGFVVHIGSFRTRERAAVYVEQLRPLVGDVFLRKTHVQGQDWYRVYLGPFATDHEARTHLANLKKQLEIDYYEIRRFDDAASE